MTSKFYRKAEGSFLDDTDYVEATSDGVVFLNTKKKRNQGFTNIIARYAEGYVEDGEWKEIQVERFRHADGEFCDDTDFVEVIDNKVYVVNQEGVRKLSAPEGITISDVEDLVDLGDWVRI